MRRFNELVAVLFVARTSPPRLPRHRGDAFSQVGIVAAVDQGGGLVLPAGELAPVFDAVQEIGRERLAGLGLHRPRSAI